MIQHLRTELSKITCRALCAGALALVLSAQTSRAAEPVRTAQLATVDFGRDIRPILSEFCYNCHGQDETSRKARLRLDDKANVFGKLRSGEIGIVPGKPLESEIFRRIIAEEESERMPPARLKKHLTAQQIAAIRRWIEEGASWSSHWAFEPIARPEVPKVRHGGWARNEIDRFILQRLEQKGVQPAPEAGAATLIRRVYLTLLGLPPTPAEIDEFLRDAQPGAYERLVDRVLQSPRLGERLAQAWLDWARFADTQGSNYDRPQSTWPWRDWVIRAFNANMPFDQFTTEQLAGDLLPHPSLDQFVATGFNRLGIRDGCACIQERRAAILTDMVNTTGSVWLGLTFQCAQCHDHKYDPLSQKDYYQFYAFFARKGDGDSRLEKDEHGNAPPTMEFTWRSAPGAAPLKTSAMIMRDDDNNAQTFILLRGNYRNLGEKVTARVPAFLNVPMEAAHAQDRLGLAHWLTDPRNPLTARVIVNRLWELVFGTGIVESSENLGLQGTLPTHPELLDWLAFTFRQTQAWNVKKLLRELVTSSTFRQSSAVPRESLERDPANHDYARFQRRRLSGEAIRDNALTIAGLLDLRMGGPPVFPVIPASEVELFEQMLGGIVSLKYMPNTGSDLHRRSIYLYYKRSQLYPPFAIFDGPTRETCAIRRGRSNTPLQSLVLLNESSFLDCARNLAWITCQEKNSSTGEKLTLSFRRCTGRVPTAAELAVLSSFLQRQSASFAANETAARELIGKQELLSSTNSDASTLAGWIVVGHVLLNLDETITVE